MLPHFERFARRDPLVAVWAASHFLRPIGLTLAVFAVGEGWHNNHNRYQRAVGNGFRWWEFDPTYYVVAAMAWLGLARNLQPVPARIYDEARRGPAPDARPTPRAGG